MGFFVGAEPSRRRGRDQGGGVFAQGAGLLQGGAWVFCRSRALSAKGALIGALVGSPRVVRWRYQKSGLGSRSASSSQPMDTSASTPTGVDPFIS